MVDGSRLREHCPSGLRSPRHRVCGAERSAGAHAAHRLGAITIPEVPPYSLVFRVEFNRMSVERECLFAATRALGEEAEVVVWSGTDRDDPWRREGVAKEPPQRIPRPARRYLNVERKASRLPGQERPSRSARSGIRAGCVSKQIAE